MGSIGVPLNNIGGGGEYFNPKWWFKFSPNKKGENATLKGCGINYFSWRDFQTIHKDIIYIVYLTFIQD